MNNYKEFWNMLSSSYDKTVMKKYDEAYKQTIELSKQYLNKNDYVLDFACGTGITTMPLCKYVNKIDAIDISKGMIDIATDKANYNEIDNVNFSVRDIFDNNIKEKTYDVIMAFNILYFFEDINTLLKRINNLLKPNGVFLSVTDCTGENKKKTNKKNIVNKVGLIPYMNKLNKLDLNELITNNGFEIMLEKNLYDNPPNYYIAARKFK